MHTKIHHTRRSTRRTLAAATLMAALVLPTVISNASPSETNNDLATAREATATFHDASAATAAGYVAFPSGVPLHECITAPDGPAAMGVHLVNPGNLDTELDPAAPEVLVYEPTQNGRQRLVALEYVVFADAWAAEHGDTTPTLFGEDLTYVGAPNRYDLPPFWQIHAWVWRNNPHGMFADHNPKVGCPE